MLGHEKEILRSKIFIGSFKQEADGLYSGHEVEPGGDSAVGDVLAGASRAARHRAATKETGDAEDSVVGEVDLYFANKSSHPGIKRDEHGLKSNGGEAP